MGSLRGLQDCGREGAREAQTHQFMVGKDRKQQPQFLLMTGKDATFSRAGVGAKMGRWLSDSNPWLV